MVKIVLPGEIEACCFEDEIGPAGPKGDPGIPGKSYLQLIEKHLSCRLVIISHGMLIDMMVIV